MTKSVYGNFDHMEQTANAIYKVTNLKGRKLIYFMFNKIVSTDSKWPGSRKVPKGWICIACPCDDNYDDKTIKYEYPEVNIQDIEYVWFTSQLDVKNYQQIKYDPYIDTQYNQNEDDDDLSIDIEDDDSSISSNSNMDNY